MSDANADPVDRCDRRSSLNKDRKGERPYTAAGPAAQGECEKAKANDQTLTIWGTDRILPIKMRRAGQRESVRFRTQWDRRNGGRPLGSLPPAPRNSHNGMRRPTSSKTRLPDSESERKKERNGKERAADNDRGLRHKRVFPAFDHCLPGGVNESRDQHDNGDGGSIPTSFVFWVEFYAPG